MLLGPAVVALAWPLYQRARELRRRGVALVLAGLHVNLIRKAGLAPSVSSIRVRDYLAWKVIDNDRTLLTAAFDIQTRWKLSYWDSLIIAAAHRSGAPMVWSENLADGQHYDDVRVINPLRLP